MTSPHPPARAFLARLCDHLGLTYRGFWALLGAVGAIFLGAAASYVLLFPHPTGGPARTAAGGCATIGLPLLIAGLSETCAARGQPFLPEDR